jgi:hypothetical protein
MRLARIGIATHLTMHGNPTVPQQRSAGSE